MSLMSQLMDVAVYKIEKPSSVCVSVAASDMLFHLIVADAPEVGAIVLTVTSEQQASPQPCVSCNHFCT